MKNASNITLSKDEKEYLESIVCSGISPPRMILGAKILLLLDKGVPVVAIANILRITRERVAYCSKKYKEGGAKFTICDTYKQSRGVSFSDEEKAWIINIVRQRADNARLFEENWNYLRLTKYINEKAEEAGHTRLSTISYSHVINILKQAGIQSRNLRNPEL